LLVKKEELVGFFAGAAIAVPWLGRIVHLPSSAIALLFVPASCLTLLSLKHEGIEFRKHTALMLLLICIYTLLVVQAASLDQIKFFLLSSEWMESQRYYLSAKLLKFLLSFVPALVMGLCVALVRDRERVLRGLFVAIVLVGTIAAINVIRYYELLFGTDYETANEYFSSTYDANIPSLVSYGFLFCIAVVTSMTLRKFWFLGGLFIFVLFLLGRRTELVTSTLAVLAFLLWSFYKRKDALLCACKTAVVIIIAAALSVILNNEISVQRWAGLWDSVKERVDILLVVTERDSAIVNSDSVGPGAPAGGGPNADTQGEVIAETPVPPSGSTLAALLFGHGLGWYSELGAANEYPHNALVETWFESGAIAAFVLGGIYGLSLVLSFAAATRRQSGLAIFLMLACLITASMKSGDIASSARLFFFILVSTSFGRALRPVSQNRTSRPEAPGQATTAVNPG